MRAWTLCIWLATKTDCWLWNHFLAVFSSLSVISLKRTRKNLLEIFDILFPLCSLLLTLSSYQSRLFTTSHFSHFFSEIKARLSNVMLQGSMTVLTLCSWNCKELVRHSCWNCKAEWRGSTLASSWSKSVRGYCKLCADALEPVLHCSAVLAKLLCAAINPCSGMA